MNRETFPATAPLVGDVSAQAGSSRATVIGLQNIPISPTPPSDQAVLRFSGFDNQWEPSVGSTAAITVNGVAVSDDYTVYVNAAPLIKVNGV